MFAPFSKSLAGAGARAFELVAVMADMTSMRMRMSLAWKRREAQDTLTFLNVFGTKGFC